MDVRIRGGLPEKRIVKYETDQQSGDKNKDQDEPGRAAVLF